MSSEVSQDNSVIFSGLRVELVVDEERFAALSVPWNALAQRCTPQSVFLRHEWFAAAWQWRREDAALRIICVYRESTLVGVLPLLALRPGKGNTRCELELLTVPDTQVCDLLAAPGDEKAVASACVWFLRRRTQAWDVLRLRYLRQNGPAWSQLVHAAAETGHSTAIATASSNPFMSLTGRWEDYYETRSRRLKKATNLVANRLQRSGAHSIKWHRPGMGDAGDIAAALDHAIDISARSWKRTTGNSLNHSGPQRFIRLLSKHAAENGWLSLWLLYLDGRAVAMEYQLTFDGDVHALRADFDESRTDVSPGSYLNIQLIKALFGQGYRRYYMGPGENAYKTRWAEAAAPMMQATIYGTGLYASWLAAWEGKIKPRLRQVRDRVTNDQRVDALNSIG